MVGCRPVQCHGMNGMLCKAYDAKEARKNQTKKDRQKTEKRYGVSGIVVVQEFVDCAASVRNI